MQKSSVLLTMDIFNLLFYFIYYYFFFCVVEFVAVHNGIITNYKDIKKFLVSQWINIPGYIFFKVENVLIVSQ